MKDKVVIITGAATKRLGLPHEVAKVVAFLLSEEASYINGQTIAIDGGESNVYGNV